MAVEEEVADDARDDGEEGEDEDGHEHDHPRIHRAAGAPVIGGLGGGEWRHRRCVAEPAAERGLGRGAIGECRLADEAGGARCACVCGARAKRVARGVVRGRRIECA